MKIQFPPQTTLYCVLFVFLFLAQSAPVFAQSDPCVGGGAALRIKPNEEIKANFFKADSNGTQVGNALALEDIENGFKEGDAISINISAPYCFYTYIVNVSELDGVSLQYPDINDPKENMGTRKNGEKKVAFKLTRLSDSTATTGREELLILITKTKIETPDLKAVLDNAGEKIKINADNAREGQTLLKSSFIASSQPVVEPQANGNTSPVISSQPKQPRIVRLVSIGCKVASIFFPFAKIACAAGGFGATSRIKTTGNAVSVSPTTDSKQLVIRFSFPVKQQ